jgi:transposase InsO family protein
MRSNGLERGELAWALGLELTCAQADIDHCLTKPRDPWTNGQVERMIRIINEATVKRLCDKTHDQLRRHLGDFINGKNFTRRLRALQSLTPYERVCKICTKEPTKFILNQSH